MLIDFGRSIDLRLYPSTTTFHDGGGERRGDPATVDPTVALTPPDVLFQGGAEGGDQCGGVEVVGGRNGESGESGESGGGCGGGGGHRADHGGMGSGGGRGRVAHWLLLVVILFGRLVCCGAMDAVTAGGGAKYDAANPLRYTLQPTDLQPHAVTDDLVDAAAIPPINWPWSSNPSYWGYPKDGGTNVAGFSVQWANLRAATRFSVYAANHPLVHRLYAVSGHGEAGPVVWLNEPVVIRGQGGGRGGGGEGPPVSFT